MENPDTNLIVVAVPVGLLGVLWTVGVLYVFFKRRAFANNAESITAQVTDTHKVSYVKKLTMAWVLVPPSQCVEFKFVAPATRGP
jgi:hypothetical protein